MPDWLHIPTLTELRDVPASELPANLTRFIQDPDLSAVEGQPKKYWIVTGNVITLMDQAAQDTLDLNLELDAAQVEDSRDPNARRLRALLGLLLDEINLLRAPHSLPPRTLDQYKTQIRTRIDAQT